ncbi:DUF1365 domain-containing protein [Endozoicomonas sp. SCSIO W0465]|uniref:DUF1365 domain-containing protein n=1 Tax=Endozoicomonas sp. SCSIO W0465 TaxID=2918516 RepID=UPI002074D700|nr:DUF1365 domain-containing protein [Endozoicomonas sp. SCSIO W0465]USE37193.1 DUF1365 domain-containing protein [Endozoicomonas sp. SCSIO W0465]
MESYPGCSIYVGQLMHHRFKPKKHRFSYRVASWLLDLDDMDALDKRLTLFSINRFNVVSFYPRDHGDGSDTPLQEQINQLLQDHSIETPDNISLLCYPRMFGYTFNPLAVYFCYRDQRLTAIVYEVSNTFGERHAYVAAVGPEDQPDDHQTIDHKKQMVKQHVVQQQADKALHVSPFFPMDCYYHFRTRPPEEYVTLGINLNNNHGKLFTAVFKGLRQPISDGFIVKQTMLLPLQTLKVIAAIHWEALRLWLKGIAIHTHTPRNFFFSHSRAEMPIAKEKNAANRGKNR